MFRKGPKKITINPKLHDPTLVAALDAFNVVRTQLHTMIVSWSDQCHALTREAEAARALGESVASTAGVVELEAVLSAFVGVGRQESDRTLALVTELSVMGEEMRTFQAKDVGDLESMFAQVDKQGKALKSYRRKGYLDPGADQTDRRTHEAAALDKAYSTLADAIESQSEKVTRRWYRMCHTIVEWWMTAKMSSYKDRYSLLRRGKDTLPPPPAKRSPRALVTSAGKPVREVNVDTMYIAPLTVEPASPPPVRGILKHRPKP